MRGVLPWYADAHWFRLLREHGWQGAQPLPVALAHAEAKCLPLVPGPRQGHWQGLSNFYTPLLQPIEGLALQDPVGLARSWRQAGLAVIDLRPLDAEAAWGAALKAALRHAGFWVDEMPAFGNWILELQGQSAADYLAARPGPLRTSLQRGRARLTRAGEWTIELLRQPGDALERALDAYEQVYAASWKPTEASPGFIRELARWMAVTGRLRLGVLRLAGQPLAAQIWFVEAGVAYIFKLAHADGQEALSPGSVLTAHLMSQVIDEDRVQIVDFISGDDAYKRDWMSRRRQRMALLAFNPSTGRGAWEGLRHFAGVHWRSLRGH